MAIIHLPSYECMREVSKHKEQARVSLASRVLRNFPSASITQQTHSKHEPIIVLPMKSSQHCILMDSLHHHRMSIRLWSTLMM